MPRPSKEEMLAMFRSRKFFELIPYFKKEVGDARSLSGARMRIMKEVDPDSFALEKQKQKEADAKRANTLSDLLHQTSKGSNNRF
jgi:hypothetical protein